MEFLTVGNITKDLIRTRDKEEYSFGGTSYSSITAARLGYKSRVLSRGNSQLSEWVKYLSGEGVEVSLQRDKNVTYFVNDYRGEKREQFLLEHTEKIEFDIEDKVDIIDLAPKFQEIDLEFIEKAREKCDIMALDVQGLVRDLRGDQVIGKFLKDRQWILPFIDFLKVGRDEVCSVSMLKSHKEICEELNSLGAKTIALTFGEEGSLVFDGNFYKIPAFKTKIVDKTGAGDVYDASFSIRYFETKDAFDSAVFATAAASFVVEDFGTKCIAKREDVEKRYQILKETLA